MSISTELWIFYVQGKRAVIRGNCAIVDGVEPSFDSIADGSYKVSRPLYFYVKDKHLGVIPGIEEYVKMFMSDEMIGEEGTLYEQGLITVAK